MKRKSSKTTRGPNAEEKRFQAWCKEQPCAVFGYDGPSIVHHCMGATYKHNKTLIGHWFCLPLSEPADNVVTRESRRVFKQKFGKQSDIWSVVIFNYMSETGIKPPDEVYRAIMGCNE